METKYQAVQIRIGNTTRRVWIELLDEEDANGQSGVVFHPKSETPNEAAQVIIDAHAQEYLNAANAVYDIEDEDEYYIAQKGINSRERELVEDIRKAQFTGPIWMI